MGSEVNKKAIPNLSGSIKVLPKLDETLTKRGCGADAKAVGDRLKEAMKAINFSYDGNGNGLEAETIQEAFDELMDKKAPAGYVESIFEVATLDDFNEKVAELEGAMAVKTIKRYVISKSVWDNSFPSADYFVEIRKAWHGYATVTATAVCEGNLVVLHRVLNDNTWNAWEWENPPMKVWEEYRIKEKWMGKPVYTKLISYTPSNDIGNAGGTYGFAIEFSTPYFKDLIRFAGSINMESGNVFPSVNTDGGFLGVNFMNSGGIALAINKKIIPAGTTIYLQLWYTKHND